MQIDNFHLMSMLEVQSPLHGLLIEWEQSPKILDNPDFLCDQVELRIQVLAQLLPALPLPEPSCEDFAIENIEKDLELLNRVMELLQNDLVLLEAEFDVSHYYVQMEALNARSQKLEAARRASYNLQQVNQNLLSLMDEIRATLKQISTTQWDQDYLWLLETRQEALLDRFEEVRGQVELFRDLYALESLLHRYQAVVSLLESLDETLEALAAVHDATQRALQV